MNGATGPRRLWGSAYQLNDLLEASPGGMGFAVFVKATSATSSASVRRNRQPIALAASISTAFG
jgi:hypothetical protein